MLRTTTGVVAALVAASAPVSAGAPASGRPDSDVHLSLTAPTTRGTWTLRITNGGDVPVRIAADARTLSLEVTPRSARAAIVCELPYDMRPENGDLERPLVLPPGRSYAESFEARLYCFGTSKGDALAPGSVVVARLGWTGKHPAGFEVAPIDGVEPRVAAVGQLEAPPVVLPDELTAAAQPQGAAPGNEGGDGETPRLALRADRWADVESLSALEVPVTLRNEGMHSVAVRFRPDALRFEVIGPGAVERCSWPVPIGAPTREQFTTLGASGTTSLVATLLSYCNAATFDRPGLYFVRAHFEARDTSRGSLGLRVFEGDLVAGEPTLVRLHKSRTSDPQRPKLEER